METDLVVWPFMDGLKCLQHIDSKKHFNTNTFNHKPLKTHLNIQQRMAQFFS